MYKNSKIRPVETTPRMGEGRVKENNGGAEFSYEIL
jgi:hypothetical protein